MVDQFYWNGLLITSSEASSLLSEGLLYRGVAYGQTWPLIPETLKDDYGKRLILKTETSLLHGVTNHTEFAPLVLTDLHLAQSYVAYCSAVEVLIRVLLLTSRRSLPRLKQKQSDYLFPHAQFLGYDYASSSGDYSALVDDFYPLPTKEFQKWRDSLNRFGLFSDLENLKNYAAFRDDFIRENSPSTLQSGELQGRQTILEDSADLVCFGTYEIAPEVLSAFETRA